MLAARYPTRPAICLVLVLSLACAREPRDPGETADRGAPRGNPRAADTAAAGMIANLRLDADVVVMESFPVQLRGTLQVENPTAEPVTFDVGGCPVFLRVYGPEGEPIWDQGDGAICTMILRTVTIEPGHAERFESASASAAEILSDDHPDGSYSVSVYLALIPEGQPEARAGEVPLAIPR